MTAPSLALCQQRSETGEPCLNLKAHLGPHSWEKLTALPTPPRGLTDAFQLEVAARTVWMEARGEEAAGITAVAWVIVNRYFARRWYSGRSLAACCLLPEQFSGWDTADINRLPMAEAASNDHVLSECREAVATAYAGQGTDPTNGATHYYDVRRKTPPPWAVGRTPVCQIGHHAFYKGVP